MFVSKLGGRCLLSMALALSASSLVRAAEPEFVGALAWAVDADGSKRLNLTEDQLKALNKLIDERESQAVSLAVQLKDATNEDREAKLGPFRKESLTKGMALLNEEQRKTLMQIRLEKMGLTVLTDPEMADQFKLTPEQRQEVARQVAERNRYMAGADEQKAAQLRQYYNLQISKVLDDAQRAQWEQIAPKPTAPAAAAGAPGGAPPGGQKPVGQPLQRTPPDPDGKLRFNFRFQPWADVLDWFAYQADLSLVMDVAPPGTFNYSDTRSYTPAEAIDLLNSVLLTKGYTLVRKDRMLIVINLEDGIPPNLITDIKMSELDDKGEYELVAVLFKLDRMTPEEAEQEIRRVIGPQGRIEVFPKSGYIRVTETAGRLRMIRSVLLGIDDGTAGSGSLKVFELKNVEMNDAMNVIRPLLDIPEEAFASTDGSIRIAVGPTGKLLVTGKPEKLARMEEVLKVIDVPFSPATGGGPTSIEAPQLNVYPITGADPASVLQVLQTLMANSPDVRLATDPKTGALVALARPTQHATIKATIDQLQRDASRVEVIKLNRVDPQTAVLSINKLFGADVAGATNAPKVDADPVTRNLLVRGSAAQIEQIHSLLEQMGETGNQPGGQAANTGGGNVRMIPLTGRAARAALEQLEQVWPTMRDNRIRVVTPSAVVPTMRLNGGEPAEAQPAEQEGPATGSGSANKPNGVLPNRPQIRSSTLRPAAAMDKSARSVRQPATSLMRFASQKGEAQQPAGNAQRPAVSPAPAASPNQSNSQQPNTTRSLPQRAEQPAAAKQPSVELHADKEGQSAPIIVAPGSGGIMIASEDIEALNEFEAMLSTLASRQFSGGKQYTIFYLTNASAASVAETLDQIFAGGGMASSSGGGSLIGDLAGSVIGGSTGGLVGSLLSLGSGGGGPLVTGPVQIIPETRLNALIVEASPTDLDTVEMLLKILDQGELPETQVAPRPRLIPVMNTSASQIAEIVREVYQERMAGGSRGSGRQPSPEEFIQMLRGSSGGSSRGGSSSRRSSNDQPKMTIGVDDRTNSLIVAAPNAMFEEVRELVETLDQATSESNTAVRVVTLKRGNPSTVQKALTAIAGENVRSSSKSSNGSSSSSSSSSRDSGSRSSGDSDAESMRRRMEWIERMRSGGGSPFGGGSSSSSRDGDRSRSYGGFGSSSSRDSRSRDSDRSRGR
jgi:type II secretory pathway component GspD/PulD (secretin)